MEVYLSWLQLWHGHHTGKPNRWSVHQRCATTSRCSLFRQPPTSCKTHMCGLESQAAWFKGNNRLPLRSSRNYSSMLNHDPGFESDISCLGYGRPSCTTNVIWKQHCIGNGGSYNSCTSNYWLVGWDGGLRSSSKHVVFSLDTELWTMYVLY